MMTSRRWWLMVLLNMGIFGTTSLVNAQERTPRFLVATRTGLVPLDIERTPALMRRISPVMNGLVLSQALDAISAESGVHFMFFRQDLPDGKRVRLKAEEITVAAALTEVLLGTGLDVVFNRDGSIVLVKRTATLPAGPPLVGMLTGRVMERGTNAPVPAAQVTVVGIISRYTDDKGQYRIPNVPVGEHTVTVKRVGFEAVSQPIRIGEGETVTADFVMARVPTMLTEMVTTATGERSRLEVGNAIGTIKADSIVPTTLIRNMSDLLTARTPGVVVSNTDGAVGAPSKIRIRGVNSLALNNDPIVILDGVRLNAQTTVATNQTNVGSQQMQFRMANGSGVDRADFNALAPSRLDDIDPNTIESIDVLRGPSASSLYGTDAANGVIVIKTKKGKVGSWRATLLGDMGASAIPGRMQDMWWGFGEAPNAAGYAGGLPVTSCVLAIGGVAQVLNGTCVQDSVRNFNPQNDPRMRTLGTGTAQTLSATLSGGSDQLQEFLSVRTTDNVGMAKMSDIEQRIITRLWSTPAPSWMVRPNTEQDIDGSSRTTIRVSPQSSISLAATAVYRNVLNGGAGTQVPNNNGAEGEGTSPADTLGFLPFESQRTKVTSLAKRGTLAANATYTPWGWLTLSSVVGGDYTLRTDAANLRAQDCTPILDAISIGGALSCPSGRSNNRGETFVTTANVGAQLSFAPVSWINFRTSVGEQYTHTDFYSLQVGNTRLCNLAFGTDLLTPSPVCGSSSGQPVQVTESRDAAATAGWYVEETVGALGMYTTFGLRQDVSSAFGSGANLRPPNYPKLSVSYPLSEQAFFPRQPLVSSLRLRLAYGQSGNQPSQKAVLNNFSLNQSMLAGSTAPVNYVFLSSLGNPDLKPERGTEWEGGFDVSFLQSERVHAEVTLYRKFTRDAISSVTLPSSLGVTTLSEFVNLGNVENRGAELSMTTRLIDSRRYGWELTINWMQNANKLVHKAPTLSASGPLVTKFREGYPLYGYWGVPVVSFADRNGDGMLGLSEIVFGAQAFMGAPYPKSELTYSNGFTFLNGALHVNANFDQINGLTNNLAVGNVIPMTRGAVDRTTPLTAQAAWIQAMMNGGYLGGTTSLRFNELSVTYSVPPTVARQIFHVQSAAFTFAGRNLALWTTYAGKDPNVSTANDYGVEETMDLGTGVPQPRNWTLRFNLGL